MLNDLGLTQREMLTGLLQNKEGMTIDHFVNLLKITRTAVNQHIKSLEKDGYVKKHSLTKTGGRPGQIYVLSDKGIHLFPKQYAWFSELLLKNLKERLGREGLEDVLRDLGEKVAAMHFDGLEGKTPTEKLMIIVAVMKKLGYESSVNTVEGDVISACNCVYHNLATEIPEICSFDLALVSAMSGRKVEHVECMVRGGHVCRFKIKETLKASDTSDYQMLRDSLQT